MVELERSDAGAIHAERWGNGDTQSSEGIGPYETYRAVALHNLRAALEAGHFESTDLRLDGVDQLLDPDTHELRHVGADLIPPERLVVEDVENERQVTVL